MMSVIDRMAAVPSVQPHKQRVKLECPIDGGHIIWNEEVHMDAESQCAICQQYKPLFICQLCYFRFCYKCRVTTENRFLKCPTDNKRLEWLINAKKCAQCEVEGPGFGCKKCNFRFCYKCSADYY
jgi:hypothetical protein